MSRRLGFVLSGGGARGAFQVGVYERLLQDPRFTDGPLVISGTSAGAINGALIAAGKSPRQMMQFWNDIADNPPVTASPVFFASAARTLAWLMVTEAAQMMMPGPRWSALWQRAQHHFPPVRGSVFAFLTEYLLTARFELISKFLEGIQAPFVADTSELRNRLRQIFGGDKVPSSEVKLAINTVDAHTGQVVRYVTKETPLTRPPDYNIVDAITIDMILASCSIPLLFPPVEIDDRLLWDGGLLVNTPLSPVVALGAEEIVTVLVTEPAEAGHQPFPHFGRAVERTVDGFLDNAYNVDRKLLLERNRLARLDKGPYREVVLYEPVRPARENCFNAGSYLYFNRDVLEAMHKAGRRAANAWLKQGPPIDRLDEPLMEDATAQAAG
ncbi:MAG TPA: patatin-like phospholipase family protein [Terriglobales bacterium]|nr:patatin-like phospholipase family protein [Terriglobales bacterium]